MNKRNLLSISDLLLTTIISKATTYYVATNGNDSNSDLDTSNAWLIWQKAFNTALPADTVFFRGGIWYIRPREYNQYINPNDTIGQGVEK